MKLRFQVCLLIAICVTGFATCVVADTIYTPPVYVGNPADSFACQVLNTSGSTISVTLTAYDSNGTVIDGPRTDNVQGKKITGMITSGGNTIYCKIVVPNLSKVRIVAYGYANERPFGVVVAK